MSLKLIDRPEASAFADQSRARKLDAPRPLQHYAGGDPLAAATAHRGERRIHVRGRHDQAEADTRKAQALAEQRRANAIALEQENKAIVAANRAKVFLAEAEVPLAMAEAFRKGSLQTLPDNGQP